MAEIVSIVYKPEGIDPKPEDRFARVSLEKTQLVAGYGIEGDSKGGHPSRQLNLMSQEMLDALCEEGYCVAPGEMGEQIILRGVDVDALAVGTVICLGDAARIEITSPREPCDRFEHIQSIAKEKIIGRQGIMAKVLTSGAIAVGDSVQVETA
jgi:MOSC domain-containing protein YiiM